MRLLPLCILHVILVSCVTTNSGISTLPNSALKRFKPGTEWISVAWNDKRTWTVSNRWRVGNQTVDPILVRSSTSDFMQADNLDPAVKVNLRKKHDLAALFDANLTLGPNYNLIFPDSLDWKALDQNRLLLTVNNDAHVVFLPSLPPKIPAIKQKLAKQELWSTPFGGMKSIDQFAQQALGLEPQKNETDKSWYLHFDSSKKVEVLIPASFPDIYTSVLNESLQTWNDAIGKTLFSPARRVQSISRSDCMSRQSLCVDWTGPAEISMMCLAAGASVAHDPGSGRVTGAIISLENKLPANLQQLEPKLAEKIKTLDLSFTEVARYSSLGFPLSSYRHPVATKCVAHIIVHELGHVLGLGHNFHTSPKSTPKIPSDTVMNYVPTVVKHAITKPTNRDRELVQTIYQNKTFQPVPYCSTPEWLIPSRTSDGKYYLNYGCRGFALGSKADWLIALATTSPKGVFAPSEGFLFVPGFLKPTLVLEFGLAFQEESGVPEEDRMKMKTFLCEQNDRAKIQTFFLEKLDQILICNHPRSS